MADLEERTKVHQSDVETSTSEERSFPPVRLLVPLCSQRNGESDHIGLVVSSSGSEEGGLNGGTAQAQEGCRQGMSRRHLSALIATSSALGVKSGH
jgi:hypothetical protein